MSDTQDRLELLDELGLDPENVKWQDLALCKGMEINDFYDEYEDDPIFAQNIDELCLSCPVVAACAKAGKINKEQGVWGGIYWSETGKPDETRNKHKTPAVWIELEKKTGLKLRK